ncbi:MAG: helix-turn-helix domain-containing protein [Proteobacteria bacterium]|nr:helix-turn-helix domain-containing protein [Pseudomonadota bacterium]
MGGWKDREIAAEYGLSERQVQRVLSAHREP